MFKKAILLFTLVFSLYLGAFFVFKNQTADADFVSIDRIVAHDVTVESDADTIQDISISSDGRYTAFSSNATNLVPDDTNGFRDIFVYDANTNTTERVSISDEGDESDSNSTETSISGDGRYVAFQTNASTLVADDTNGNNDVFVYDRNIDTIERVSVDDMGGEGDGVSTSPSISADGRYVAFQSDSTNLVADDTNGVTDVFVYDRNTDTIERVSVDDMGVEGDGSSAYPSISSDGNFVSFESTATNLVADDTNGQTDIFVYDRTLDTVIDITPDGNSTSSNSSISTDGLFVSFDSTATNLVGGDVNAQSDVFVYDVALDSIEMVSISDASVHGNDSSAISSISGDGRYVSFSSSSTNLVAGDTNASNDIFVYDRTGNTIERISVDDDGVEGNSGSFTNFISSDGTHVAFQSSATNLVSGDTNNLDDVFIYDRDAGTEERVTVFADTAEPNDGSEHASTSSDGQYTAFTSCATNLVSYDTNGQCDVFVYNSATDAIERVSVNDDGEEADGESTEPSISLDGRYVAFTSEATNLVDDDTNGQPDIFVYDRDTDTIRRVSVTSEGEEADDDSSGAFISSNGSYVAFTSDATNLVADDTNNEADVFVYDLSTDIIERVSVNTAGVEGNNSSQNPSISSDGRYIAFDSDATNLVDGDTNVTIDIFVHDREMNITTRISVNNEAVEGDDSSDFPFISLDGHYISFESSADNLVADDTNGVFDIFVYDMSTSSIERVSISSDGDEAIDGDSYYSSISSGGRYVTFISGATNLVADDTNDTEDAFVYDRNTDTTDRISVSNVGDEADDQSGDGFRPSISSDGTTVAFDSNATNLVDDDTGGQPDIFLVALDGEEDAPDYTWDDEDNSPHTSSGSSASLIAKNLLNNLPSPSTPPTDCLPTYIFSPSTGAKCSTSTTPDISKFQFLKNLKLGMIDPDVLQLQKYLNTHGYVLATTGAGSLGHETLKFGKLTLKALIKFQIANHITPPVGFFGPITRGVVNKY